MSLESFAQQLLDELCQRHPLGYTPTIRWRGYRVSAGMAYYKLRIIGLSRTVIDDAQKLRDTLIHEYAHLLAYHRHGRRGIGHGAEWQAAMRDLGAEPKVRHCYPVQRNARKQQVGYKCERCGTTLVRSRKLPKRRRYMHAGCGGAIKYVWTREVTHEAVGA